MSSETKIEKVDGRFLRHRRCVGESNFHLQFTPNFRKDVFLPEEVRILCKQCFYQKAAELGIVVLAVNFGPDHAHLFIGNCRKYSAAQLAQYFKGYSSRVMRAQLWSSISPYLSGKRFWSEGYFFESVGRVTSESVKFYIERQQGKHWVHYDFDVKQKQGNPAQSSLAEFF
ncbi:MAG: IS200/IS605 family transposase [Candidatus Micrarchaeota archaeon]